MYLSRAVKNSRYADDYFSGTCEIRLNGPEMESGGLYRLRLGKTLSPSVGIVSPLAEIV